MFHAARAVLLQIDGDRAPLKHTAVVGRFGQLAKTRDDPLLRIAGRLINRVLEARVDADYNVRHPTDSLTATTAIQSARQFIEICSGAFGFPAPLP